MLKKLKDFYIEDIQEQEQLLTELRILLEETNLDNLLKIIQSEPTKKQRLKMLDLLHDKNKFLEYLEMFLNSKAQELSTIFKVKRTNYNTVCFYVQESVGSLFLLGEYNINTNVYTHNDDFLLEKEKISNKFNEIEKNISTLKHEKDTLKVRSVDLTKIELMLKVDQKLKSSIYEIDKKLNKYITESKNFDLQYKNLHFLFKNIQLYYRLLEELKGLNIVVNEDLFLAKNEYRVFIYKEPQENKRKTSIVKKYTSLYNDLINTDITTNKVFISLENFIRALPENIGYIRNDDYVEIELDFTSYRFYESGLITIDNIYGNIYDLFEMGIFDIIEKSCNTLTVNESYL